MLSLITSNTKWNFNVKSPSKFGKQNRQEYLKTGKDDSFKKHL